MWWRILGAWRAFGRPDITDPAQNNGFANAFGATYGE